MSLDHLGAPFDLHGGGHDLRFPHHEAEIMQGECHTGTEPIVGIWMHNGFVNVDGEKMSKSLDNFWTIQEILADNDPLVLRLALINASYRAPIDMNPTLLEDARTTIDGCWASYADASCAQRATLRRQRSTFQRVWSDRTWTWWTSSGGWRSSLCGSHSPWMMISTVASRWLRSWPR